MMAGRNGAILTLSHPGAERALPHYNVVGSAKAGLEANVRYLAFDLGPEGTRINAISAGPIKALAAAGIADFRKMLDHVNANAPLRRSVTIDELGNVGAFLCSDLASGITGGVTHVEPVTTSWARPASDRPTKSVDLKRKGATAGRPFFRDAGCARQPALTTVAG